mgnify:CR=1 FL=1
MWIKDSYTKQLEGDLDHQRDSINDLQNQRSSSIAHQNLLVQRIVALNEELAKKDALILEWMHTNAAFRKLTKDYAARLGISEEERVQNVDQARVDVALDDPAFQHTQLYIKALTRVEKRKSEGTS